jgi:5'(3')-deoxyribonucleotidase
MKEAIKERIAIDKDDVLINLNGGLHPYHNNHYGTNVVFEALHTFNLWEIWECTKEQAVERVFEFYHSEEFPQLVPVEGAVEAVNNLKVKYDLVVVSSRPAFMLERTHQSIDKYFPGCFSEVHLTDSYGPVGLYRKKSQVCQEVGAVAIIDDHIENTRDCALNGVKPYLFRAPWNLMYSDRQLESEGITPLRDWSDALEKLL